MALLRIVTVIDGELHEWRELPDGDCRWFVLDLDELVELEAVVAAAKARAAVAVPEAQVPLPLGVEVGTGASVKAA